MRADCRRSVPGFRHRRARDLCSWVVWRCPWPPLGGRGLFADSELVDEAAVPLQVLLLQVVQQAPPLPDQHHEPATGMMVLRVGLEMLGQVADALAQDGDLDLGRPGVLGVGPEPTDDVGLPLLGESHPPYLRIAFLVKAGMLSRS